jgi:hypothetical protein
MSSAVFAAQYVTCPGDPIAPLIDEKSARKVVFGVHWSSVSTPYLVFGKVTRRTSVQELKCSYADDKYRFKDGRTQESKYTLFKASPK